MSIAIKLVCVATLDPGSTIRRAASAAYQELVGRQSSQSDRVPKGITVLTMMDYHAVGSRRGAFEAAVNVAKVDYRYRTGIVNWCVDRGVGHWDEKGREGVSKVLGRIFAVDRDGIQDLLVKLVRLQLKLPNLLDWILVTSRCVEDPWKPSRNWRIDSDHLSRRPGFGFGF